ncbi:MAG TPA: hypothetical protein PLD95_00630 [bacterium]|jgi:ABC-type antimicrobial peptide transport system permease subunit|nr:hypothetical protein [bacterium]HOG37958.1 hypothetical protein [bacterium]HQI03017.1 hypothetical protein [bacterium]
MWKKILIIISIILFISLVIYIVIYDSKNQENIINNTQSISDEREATKIQSENCMGAIEGELSYPSEIVPDGSLVCAKNIETNNYYCTPNQVINSKYRNKKGYRLEVPRGIYSVSSVFPFALTEQLIKQNMFVEYKYAGDNCRASTCRDEYAPVMVGCETVENIGLFRVGSLGIFKDFLINK